MLGGKQSWQPRKKSQDAGIEKKKEGEPVFRINCVLGMSRAYLVSGPKPVSEGVTDEETAAQRGSKTCPSYHSQEIGLNHHWSFQSVNKQLKSLTLPRSIWILKTELMGRVSDKKKKESLTGLISSRGQWEWHKCISHRERITQGGRWFAFEFCIWNYTFGIKRNSTREQGCWVG